MNGVSTRKGWCIVVALGWLVWAARKPNSDPNRKQPIHTWYAQGGYKYKLIRQGLNLNVCTARPSNSMAFVRRIECRSVSHTMLVFIGRPCREHSSTAQCVTVCHCVSLCVTVCVCEAYMSVIAVRGVSTALPPSVEFSLLQRERASEVCLLLPVGASHGKQHVCSPRSHKWKRL